MKMKRYRELPKNRLPTLLAIRLQLHLKATQFMFKVSKIMALSGNRLAHRDVFVVMNLDLG